MHSDGNRQSSSAVRTRHRSRWHCTQRCCCMPSIKWQPPAWSQKPNTFAIAANLNGQCERHHHRDGTKCYIQCFNFTADRSCSRLWQVIFVFVFSFSFTSDLRVLSGTRGACCVGHPWCPHAPSPDRPHSQHAEKRERDQKKLGVVCSDEGSCRH